VVLRTCTAAACRLWSLAAERLACVKTYCVVVCHAVVVRVNRTDELVVENALIVVHIACVVRIKAVEILCELREVVHAACLVEGRVRVEVAVTVRMNVCVHAEDLCVRLAEHLHVTYTTCRICVTSLDHVPEVDGDVVVIWVVVAHIALQRADDLRDMLVCMTCADVVHID